MTNKFRLVASSLVLAGFLVACGGSSSSSDDSTTTTGNGGGTTPPATTLKKCVPDANSVVHLTEKACTYSFPKFNNGEDIEYSCINGEVIGKTKNFTSKSGEDTNMYGTIFTCKK